MLEAYYRGNCNFQVFQFAITHDTELKSYTDILESCKSKTLTKRPTQQVQVPGYPNKRSSSKTAYYQKILDEQKEEKDEVL